MRFQNYIFFIILFFSIPINAQKDSLKIVFLDPVVVKSSRIVERELKIPLAIATLNYEETQEIRQQLSLYDYIKNVPGLFALNSNNFSQDLRVSIRGFGARSAFGIRGVKILVDGIPETTPDGQGQIDNLNIGIIKSIEVIKGPAASLYGNASGGVISIYTLDSVDENYANAGVTFGSYDLQQYQTTVGFSSEGNSFILQGTNTKTAGYRDQSGFKNSNLNLRMRHVFSKDTKINIHLNYTDSPNADDAGGLTLNEAQEDRRQARSTNLEYKTKERINQFKSGINFNHKWAQNSFNTYGFYSSRNFYGLLPFEFGGIVDLKRNYFGFGSNFTFESSPGKTQNTLQIGYDFANQKDDRLRFKNLIGAQGEKTFDQIESFRTIGVFALDHFSVGNFLIRAGIRYDTNDLQASDLFLSNGDQSGDIQLTSWNPSFGVSYQLFKQQYFYTNFSTSFETPVLSELSANPTGNGGFNEFLKAQKATNYEVGYKLKTRKSHVEIALFQIETSNDIVPYELEEFPDRTFYKNAGKTLRKGVELSYTLKIAQHLNVSAGYTFSKFNYKYYLTTAGNYNDKQLPGIPEQMGSAALNYQKTTGLNILLSSQYVGKIYVNDANTVADKSYLITNISAGYKIMGKHLNLTPFLGLNNLFNTKYNDNIRINAFGGRYYEPAPGFHVFGGLRVYHSL